MKNSNMKKQLIVGSFLTTTIITIVFFFFLIDKDRDYDGSRQDISNIDKMIHIHNLNIAIRKAVEINHLKKKAHINEDKIQLDIDALNNKEISSLYKLTRYSNDDIQNFINYTTILENLDIYALDIAELSNLSHHRDKTVRLLVSIIVVSVPKMIKNIRIIKEIGAGTSDISLTKNQKFILDRNIYEFKKTTQKTLNIISKLSSEDIHKLKSTMDIIVHNFNTINILVDEIKNKQINSIGYSMITATLISKIDNLFSETIYILEEKIDTHQTNNIKSFTIGVVFYLLFITLIVEYSVRVYKTIKKYLDTEKKERKKYEFTRLLKNYYDKKYNLKKICNGSLRQLIYNFNAINGSLYLLDQENKKLFLGGFYGIKRADINDILYVDENTISQSISESQSKVIDIEQKIKIGTIKVTGTKLMLIPIINFQNAIGVVQLVFDDKKYKQLDKKFLQDTISLMAVHIDKSREDEKFKQYLEVINKNIMIYRTDLDGRINIASESLCKFYGYTQKEIIGLNHKIFSSEKKSKIDFKNMSDAIKKGQDWSLETIDTLRDGSTNWMLTKISPNFDINRHIIGYTSIKLNIMDKKELEKASITDSLTGIYNRRHFNNMFPANIKVLKRSHNFLVFIMIDIDFFKQYNDEYGHQAGDIALKNIAKAIQITVSRPDDFAFRLGGEEFGILFYATNNTSGKYVANKIMEVIQNLKIKHIKSNISKYLTVSAGVYVISKDNEKTVDEIYNLTDKALYLAKQSGRNQIAVAN